MYKLITMQGRARRGTFTTVHGKIEMPAFMNVRHFGRNQGRYLFLRPERPALPG